MDLAWPIVISSLVFLSYSAWSIAREKDLYEKTAMPINLGGYQFLIPAWWSKASDLQSAATLTSDQLIYYRSDINYDWRCAIGNLSGSLISAHQHCQKLMLDLDLFFDSDALNTLPWKNVAKQFECARIEGTATRDDEFRVYADIVVVKNCATDETVYLWSISSILNGCVEGPYVEEVLKRMLFQNQPLELNSLS